MESVEEKELPEVKIIYDTCGEGVTVYVFRPDEWLFHKSKSFLADFCRFHLWGDAEFDSWEQAESWVARQKFKVVEVAND
jgi:hypothetical protein